MSTEHRAGPPPSESVFTYGAPTLKFGDGASDEVGYDLSQLGATRALVVTDPGVAATGLADRVADQLARFGVTAQVYADARVEPTDASMQAAIDWARANGPWDALVAVGGGSSIDTTGTGSQSTTVCVLDVLAQQVKTGISHPRLRPTLAVVDPLVTLTQPAGVTAASGMDILCHALESYTARPYTSGPRKDPAARVPYCGANPVSDMWSEKAMSLLATSFRRAVLHGDDVGARREMTMAATFAGLGFGNAGVHIPHANAYPIAGQVRDFHPDGYPADEPLVPHGMAVSLTAPEAFRFTFDASPDRHRRAAQLLEPGAESSSDAASLLPDVLTRLMRDIGIPDGIGAVGFGDADVDDLVDGALKQQRLLAIAPRPVTADDLAGIFRRSMSLW